MASFYDISHPDVFVHLRNTTQELTLSIPQADILLTNVVSIMSSEWLDGPGRQLEMTCAQCEGCQGLPRNEADVRCIMAPSCTKSRSS